VAAAVIDGLSSLRLAYPKVDKEKQKELEAAKHTLMISNDHLGAGLPI
jgi:hypothetical protein